MSSPHNSNPSHRGIAFLLAQIGAHAGELFAERLKPLKLVPAEAGILRILAASNGISQRALAKMLGMYPSRLVAVIDAMERSKLVERRTGTGDRRIFEIHLTPRGKEKLAAVSLVAQEHKQLICHSLTAQEQETLSELLTKIAEDRKLVPGVHPGYRRIRNRKNGC
jgi:DNA-binding MarR family transcriptional regulator